MVGTRTKPVSRSTSTSATHALYEYAGAAVLPGAHRWSVGTDRPDRSFGGLSQLDRLGKRHAAFPILGVEYPAVGERQPLDRHLELPRCMDAENLPRALGRLQRGVPGHQRNAARIAAQVYGSEVRVGGDDGDIERIDTEHFGDDVREDRIRALPDLRRAAEHRDAAAAVALQLDARMRHVVPVDRQAGARDVARAREPNAAALGQLAEFLLPPRPLDYLLDAFAEAHGPHPQVIRRQRVRWHERLETQLGRVDGELLGDLVEMHLEREPRLRRAVPALGPARRLVGEGARALEVVARDIVGDGLKRARVVRARDAVRAVRAAIEQGFEIDRK